MLTLLMMGLNNYNMVKLQTLHSNYTLESTKKIGDRSASK